MERTQKGAQRGSIKKILKGKIFEEGTYEKKVDVGLNGDRTTTGNSEA